MKKYDYSDYGFKFTLCIRHRYTNDVIGWYHGFSGAKEISVSGPDNMNGMTPDLIYRSHILFDRTRQLSLPGNVVLLSDTQAWNLINESIGVHHDMIGITEMVYCHKVKLTEAEKKARDENLAKNGNEEADVKFEPTEDQLKAVEDLIGGWGKA